MSLDKRNLNILFLITLLLTLFVPSLYPSIRLLFFAPLLIVSYYQCSLTKSLWYAFICGLCLDLFTIEARFGIYALDFMLTTLVLYPQKRHFFADNLSTLPLMTYFFSVTSALVLLTLSYAFNQPVPINPRWFITDIIIMPLADMLYATLAFVIPFLLLGKRPRKGKDYFIN